MISTVCDLAFIMKSDVFVAVLFLKHFAFSLLHRDFIVNEGRNLTISCGESNESSIWSRNEVEINSNYNHLIRDANSLVFIDITLNDAGLYICSTLNSSDRESYQEYLHANVKVRTKPGAVGMFRVRATTIIAVLIWEAWRNRTGGFPIIDYTAEMRRLPEIYPNNTEEIIEWEMIDPHHITPNARQLEVYHLKPNTSYQFRIWANNELGSGDVYTISAKTLPPTMEKDLIMRILRDAKEFDTRIWIAAVAIVMGTLLILTCGTCIVLYKECQEYSEDESDMGLVQNMHVILNPGFCDDDHRAPLSPIKTNYYAYHHGDYDKYDKADMTFSRKMSIFFTGNTIKRI